MADTVHSLDVAAEDCFDIDNATALKASTSLQPFDGAGYDVPHDLLVLAGKGHRHHIPLSLLTRPAILAAKTGKRAPLIEADVKFDPLSLEPFNELEKTLDYASWCQAMAMVPLILEQTMSDKVAKFYIKWLTRHQHEIRLRLSHDSWPIILAYDISQRKTWMAKLRQGELGVKAGEKVPAVKMEDWDVPAFEAAAASFGTTSSDLYSLYKDGSSPTGTLFNAVVGVMSKTSLTVTTSSTVQAAYKQNKVSPALAEGIRVSGALAQKFKDDALSKLRSSGRILSGAAVAGAPPSPVSPTISRPTVPQQVDPAVVFARQQQLAAQQQQQLLQQGQRMLQQQAQQVAFAQKQQQQAVPVVAAPVQQVSAVPAAYPVGTYPALHPNPRLNAPNAVDQMNAARPTSFGRCGVCGVEKPGHVWFECPNPDMRILERMGKGFRVKGTSQACCHTLNAYGCSKPSCTYLHACMRCGEVWEGKDPQGKDARPLAHGRHNCLASGPAQRILDLERGFGGLSLGGGNGGGGGASGFGGAGNGTGAGVGGGYGAYGGAAASGSGTTSNAQWGGNAGAAGGSGANAQPVVPAKRTADGAVKSEESSIDSLFASFNQDWSTAPILTTGAVDWNFQGGGGGNL